VSSVVKSVKVLLDGHISWTVHCSCYENDLMF